MSTFYKWFFIGAVCGLGLLSVEAVRADGPPTVPIISYCAYTAESISEDASTKGYAVEHSGISSNGKFLFVTFTHEGEFTSFVILPNGVACQYATGETINFNFKLPGDPA